MNKKIAIAIILMSWVTVPSAFAMDSATGYGSGTYSTTYYSGSGSGTTTDSGSSYTPPGDITYSGSGSGTGSGCWYGCTVPEPETYMLLGIGFLGIYLARRRK